MPSRLARISESGDIYIYEPVASIPAGSRPVAAEEVDPVVRTLFPDATCLRNEDRYLICTRDGRLFEERAVPDVCPLPAFSRSYQIDPDLPPVAIERFFSRRAPSGLQPVSPDEFDPRRVARITASLGGGPPDRFRFFSRDGLLTAVVLLDRGVLCAREKLVPKPEGIRRIDLARYLEVYPSRIARILERLGKKSPRRGPAPGLDHGTIAKILDELSADVDPSRIEFVRRLLER